MNFQLIFLITFALTRVMPQLKWLKRPILVIKNLLEFDFSPSLSSTAISLIILFHSLYFMIYKSIITNNIKTNSVVVDVSEIVDTRENFLATKKKICFYKDEFEHLLAKTAPPGTFLHKIYGKASEQNGNVCNFTTQTFPNLESYDLDETILFLNDWSLYGIASFLSPMLGDNFYYYSPKAHFSSVAVLYVAKNQVEQSIYNYLMLTQMMLFETGILTTAKKELILTFYQRFMYRTRSFQSKKDIMAEFYKVHILSYGYIEKVIFIYLALNASIITVFLIVFFVKKIRKIRPN